MNNISFKFFSIQIPPLGLNFKKLGFVFQYFFEKEFLNLKNNLLLVEQNYKNRLLQIATYFLNLFQI